MYSKILAGSSALALIAPAFAGTLTKSADVSKPAEKSALTFADGLVTVDLEGRLRFEARSNNRNFDDSINDANDDSWVISRFRIGVALQLAPWAKLYAQTQDTREWNSERVNVPGVNGTEGGDEFDLRQAYLQLSDYKEFPLGITIGRQPLNYGDNRLVADSKWGNFGRTFDGAKLRYQQDKFWVDAFAVRPVQTKEEVFNNNDAEDNFAGIYGGTDALGFQSTELYFLYRDKQDNQSDLDPTNKLDPRGAWNGPAQRIYTVGTRWKSKKDALGPWDYSAEFAYQFGDTWTNDRATPRLEHSAFATAITGGYTWKNAAWKPRLSLEYDYASGDSNPADGSSQSFQNLFPSNHAHYGFMDEFAWRNIHDLRLQMNANPTKKLELELDYHLFWLADTGDYWYRSNGYSTLRTTTPTGANVRTVGANNFAGSEIDLTATWKVTCTLTIQGGYSHFFAGSYLADTGASDDADFAYLQATVVF